MLAAVGAYGLAIILLTVLIKLILSPLFQLQLILSRRSMQQQRKLAPQMAELRKKYKGSREKQQAAMMELYREHNVNPLGNLSGCLPSLVQLPILSALYYVFYGNARANTFHDHFLFIPHLNVSPVAHPLVSGLPIPSLVYLVIPILAAASTFVQSRMMQQPPNPAASEQEQQAQNVSRQMQVFMPLMILYFAVITPAGLGLYWLISNCFAIIQQYLVNGWGGLRPAAASPIAVATSVNASKPSNPSAVKATSGRSPRPQPRSTVATDPKRPRKSKR